MRAEAKKPIKSRKTGAKLYANTVSDALEAREIVKGSVQENCPMTAKQALTELCEAVRAEPVQAIGRKFTLYRPNHDEPKIQLPR